jgi:tRNA dimethylallyltransferase
MAPLGRLQLHQRIEMRFDRMLDAGLVGEVRELRRKYDLNAGLPSMRAVGYRQVWRFLEGEISQKEMRDAAVAATRQLAKRQLTWLRSLPDFAPAEELESAIGRP